MNKFKDRLIRAAKLDISLYEEVEADPGTMKQAMGTVVLSSLAAGIGSSSIFGLKNLIFGIIAALLSWYVWAYLTYLIGVKLFPEPQTRSDHGELLRTIGFSSSPGILRILGIIPGLAVVLFFITGIWMLIAMIIAVRQALDYHSTARAVGVCLVGWVLQMILMVLVFKLIGISP